MQALKSLAQGFLVATGLVWIFNVTALIRSGDPWLGLLYLLIIVLAASSLAILKFRTKNTTRDEAFVRWRNLLFAFQGVALAFWTFDIATTIYAINVTGLAIELNPLGWPWGILGAFAFYGPTFLFSYVLLFRMKEKLCIYAAIPLTLVTLGMGTMNLIAGAQNFNVFVDTASLASGIRFGLLALVLALDLAVPLAIYRTLPQPKADLTIKTP